jgi:hypothetical protein
VTGPASIFLTTTAIDVDEELLNRCIVLTVDEGRAQTKAIHQRQRAAQTLDGLLAGAEAEDVRRLHQNAQRLLEPLAVVNPHAGSLAFADGAVRARRDHVKYLTLIAAVTLLHQHQRQVKTVTRGGQVIRYVETTSADIELADRLAAEVLARSLDELPPGTRRLLDAIAGYVTARCLAEGLDADLVRFTRRQLREALPFGDTQLKVHLARLATMSWSSSAGWSRAGSAMSWPGSCRRAAAGMRLRHQTGRGHRACGRGLVGPRSGGGRPPAGPVLTR